MTPEEFWHILQDVPAAPPVSFRLYHDDHGMPIVYTMEDLGGNYIEVDREMYLLAPMDARVVDGQLIYNPKKPHMPKLKPSKESGTPCHPDSVCVVIDENATHIKWRKR